MTADVLTAAISATAAAATSTTAAAATSTTAAAATSAIAAVAVCGLHKTFRDRKSGQTTCALNGVSLEVPAGALAALVGADGAGKTTFLRLVAGLLVPDSGALQVLGLDVTVSPQAVQNRISYMPQRFGLYDDLTVAENLELYAGLHGVPSADLAERQAHLLEMTELSAFTTRLAGNLSGGMKQKLGLACTLVHAPDLLLLDEPSVGVDPLSRREIWGIITELRRSQRLTVLISTAYMEEAARCGQVFMLHEGALLAAGSPESLCEHARGRCYAVGIPKNLTARAVQASLLRRPDLFADAVPHAGLVRCVRRKNADVAGFQAEPVEARLEDGFMALLRDSEGDGAPAAMQGGCFQKTGTSANAVAAQPRELPATTTEEDLVVVRDLTRRFGAFVAVDRTSFSVRRGEIFGLLGPNGAGKTTTFRMLCGLLPPSDGTLRVAGVDLRHAPAEARARIGYVAQKFSLYGNLSVRENMEFFGGVYGLGRAMLQERVTEALTRFDLPGEAMSGLLPGGFRQRLAMAVALLHEPDILFLDEPTSGIDIPARRAFWQRITALAEAGTTVIVTTHFMEEAEYCDRVVIQDAGKVLTMGTPEAIRRQTGSVHMEDAFLRTVEMARHTKRGGA